MRVLKQMLKSFAIAMMGLQLPFLFLMIYAVESEKTALFSTIIYAIVQTVMWFCGDMIPCKNELNKS